MTQWVVNNHQNLFVASLTSLMISVMPDAIIMDAGTIADQTLQGVTVVKEIIQALAGLITIVFTVMLICLKMNEFKKWIRKRLKQTKEGNNANN